MKVFVYGTLKKGFHNHDFITHSDGEYVGDGWLSGFRMTDGGHNCFPVALKDDTATMYGEIYDVSTLENTDYLEGYPHHYDRTEVNTEVGKVWIYFQHETHPEAEDVVDGVWQ